MISKEQLWYSVRTDEIGICHLVWDCDESMSNTEVFENSTTIYHGSTDVTQPEDGAIHCQAPETYVWKYVAPVLLTVGSLGNVLTIVAISCRPILRSSTSSMYLAVLAMADLLVLYSGLLVKTLQRAQVLEIWTSSDAGCKIGYFLMFFGEQFEAWVLVQLSLERLAAVFVPMLYKNLFTPNRAAKGLLSSATILVLFNIHWFWTLRLLPQHIAGHERPCCGVVDSTSAVFFLRVVWTWIDLILSSALPFIIMLAVNTSIIVQLTCQRHRSTIKKTRITGMTLTLLTINFTFLILTGPLVIFLAIWPTNNYANHVLFDVFEMMNYANYAINFLLYCVSGPRFRREFIHLLTKGKCKTKVGPTPVTEATKPSERNSNRY